MKGRLGAPDLDAGSVSRVIEMAWDDATPFEAIHAQFGLSEPAVRALMRQQLKTGSYRLWRKRVRGRPGKHAAVARNWSKLTRKRGRGAGCFG